jgi:hypothetical protein
MTAGRFRRLVNRRGQLVEAVVFGCEDRTAGSANFLHHDRSFIFEEDNRADIKIALQECRERARPATRGLAVVKQHHIDAPCIDQCRGVVESDNAADHFDPMAGKNLRQQLAQKTLIVVHKQYSNVVT